MNKRTVGQILKETGAVNDAQVQKALEFAKANSCRIGEALVKTGVCTQQTVSRALAKHWGLPFANLGKGEIKQEIIATVPKEVAIENSIVPVTRKNGSLVVAMSNLDYMVLDNLRFLLNQQVVPAIATPEDIEEALDHYYRLTGDLSQVLGDQDGLQVGREDYAGEDSEANDAPVIKYVTQLISNALKERASDIHVEPFEKRVRIRYRIDGVCVEKENPPKKLQGPIISRIKIMARMDMAEKRRPQDGRIKIQLHGREIDLRVSSLPARHGESVVMRILDKEKSLVDLEQLGFHESEYQRFAKIIKRPNGIFLVTGPTGSGKTTTLYAALKKLNRPDVKIITAENPVEYNLAGINQSEVRHEIGLTFQRILRAMMRQAPNIILVGEIRDRETADIATQAALTGHLVFSTLHTNDAPSAITRLIDMGVKPFLVASAIMAILAQRLVRILCPECKEAYEPTDVELRSVGLTRQRLEGSTVYRAVGCPACNGTGYKGRKGVYELMEMSPDLREMSFKKKPTMELRAKALAEGMADLQQDGVRKILAGLTTFEEVLSITHSLD
ncbi:MAG: Flp pilus assembly complex ATPase component TadA [Planctomycetes bacterium]|nr:Flp pilus assembly complex ATPase component TadA [Planctomycetota bacterium]